MEKEIAWERISQYGRKSFPRWGVSCADSGSLRGGQAVFGRQETGVNCLLPYRIQMLEFTVGEHPHALQHGIASPAQEIADMAVRPGGKPWVASGLHPGVSGWRGSGSRDPSGGSLIL
jgi:hypothetical protein